MNQHSGMNNPSNNERGGREQSRGVAQGLWGGEHIRLEVTDAGARLEYDCGHGSIDEKLATDAEGRFDVAGRHVHEHGGPIRVGARPDEHPARYTGRVEGSTMSLRVILTDTQLDLGDYTLRRGEEAQLVKCL